jgi:hypothetical protein
MIPAMRLCLGKREREKRGKNIIRLENRTDRQVLVLMEECQKYVEVSSLLSLSSVLSSAKFYSAWHSAMKRRIRSQRL